MFTCFTRPDSSVVAMLRRNYGAMTSGEVTKLLDNPAPFGMHIFNVNTQCSQYNYLIHMDGDRVYRKFTEKSRLGIDSIAAFKLANGDVCGVRLYGPLIHYYSIKKPWGGTEVYIEQKTSDQVGSCMERIYGCEEVKERISKLYDGEFQNSLDTYRGRVSFISITDLTPEKPVKGPDGRYGLLSPRQLQVAKEAGLCCVVSALHMHM